MKNGLLIISQLNQVIGNLQALQTTCEWKEKREWTKEDWQRLIDKMDSAITMLEDGMNTPYMQIPLGKDQYNPDSYKLEEKCTFVDNYD